MSESIFSLHVYSCWTCWHSVFFLYYYSASFRVGKAVIPSVEALVDAVNLNNNIMEFTCIHACMSYIGKFFKYVFQKFKKCWNRWMKLYLLTTFTWHVGTAILLSDHPYIKGVRQAILLKNCYSKHAFYAVSRGLAVFL